jgi:hypothetical protein
MRPAARTCAASRAARLPCRLDVAIDLRHQLCLAAERLLVAQALPELERQRFP